MDIQKRTALLLQILDPTTKQHIASVREADFNKFYTMIMNFANNASMGNAVTEKGLNAVTEKAKTEEEDYNQYDWLNALGGGKGGGGCHICGSMDHWKSQCPHKGKGKGKGPEGPKGGSKGGKGPVDGWHGPT